jgi:hypothetical protein
MREKILSGSKFEYKTIFRSIVNGDRAVIGPYCSNVTPCSTKAFQSKCQPLV